MSLKRLSTDERGKIEEMRRAGSSIGEICAALGRQKSTIYYHLKNITLSSELSHNLRSRRGGSAMRASRRREEAYRRAASLVGRLGKRDKLVILACLYWGEGSKREFGFTNSDPKLIETFVSCLKEIGVDEDRLKISLRLYEDIDVSSAKQHWARVIGVRPSMISSINFLSGKKEGKLPFGMCRIRVEKANEYFNLIMALIKSIAEEFAPIASTMQKESITPS